MQAVNGKNWADFKRRTYYWRIAREATSADVAELTPRGKLYRAYTQAGVYGQQRKALIDIAIERYRMTTGA